MFDFGKSLINMNPDEQKKVLDNATSGQRNMALEMGIGFNKPKPRQQPKQQKRDAYHDLDRLNTIVEEENEAHDFFGKGLNNWQKKVTGNRPSKDATTLKKQFDEYEHGILSDLPKGGKRHGALSETLPKIKNGFLKQGHQFALDKLNEQSRSILDNGLQRIAKGALEAKDEKGIQAHDDQAFDLINKCVISEAKFDEKDADTMYDKYLKYAGVDLKEARIPENKELPETKAGFEMEDAETDTGTMSDAGGKEKADDADFQIPEGQNEIYDGNQYRGKVMEGEDQVKSAEKSQPKQNEMKEFKKTSKTRVTNPYTEKVKEYEGRKVNPKPGGKNGPTISFTNDNKRGNDPNQPLQPQMVKAIEEVVKKTALSVNVNSTTEGKHSKESRHYRGMGIDINMINGMRVDAPKNSENMKKLQEAMEKHPAMRECFGPSINVHNKPEQGGKKARKDQENGHKNHIYFTTQ